MIYQAFILITYERGDEKKIPKGGASFQYRGGDLYKLFTLLTRIIHR
jgi:hypothetical protein